MAERKLNLTDLKPAQPRKDRKRVGRGPGSGKGRYAGRGIKGQKSRSGSHKMRAGFEGGQMPIYMRIGKLRGSTSKDAMPVGPFRTHTVAVNVRDLDRFDEGDDVTPETLVEKRLLKNTKIDVKLLGNGDISKKLIELLREPKVRKVKTHTAKPEAAEEPEETAADAKEETPVDEAAPDPEE